MQFAGCKNTELLKRGVCVQYRAGVSLLDQEEEHMKRRIIAILLAVTLVGGTCLTAYAEENNSQNAEVAQSVEDDSQSAEAAQITEENDSQTEETTKIIEEQDADQGIAVQSKDCKVWLIRIGNQYFDPNGSSWTETTKEFYPGVTYDIENNVLTFNNADISVPKVLTDSGRNVYPPFGITAQGKESDLTVVIKGTNRIGFSETIGDDLVIDNVMHFSGFRKVKFTGDGSLTLDCQGKMYDGISMGFCPADSRDVDGTKFEMEECTLEIDATKTSDYFNGIRTSDDFTMRSGQLIIDGRGEKIKGFRGIGPQASYGRAVNILGGTVEIYGANAHSIGFDVEHGVLNIENADINIDNRLYERGYAFNGKKDEEGLCKESGMIYITNSNIQYQSQSGDSILCAGLVENGKLYNYVGDKKADQRVESLVYEAFFGNYCGYANFIISTKPLQGESEVTLGDINADGQINLTDVVLCLNHSSKKSLLTGDALAAADINQDGAVNLTDVMRLMNYVAKKSTTL